MITLILAYAFLAIAGWRACNLYPTAWLYVSMFLVMIAGIAVANHYVQQSTDIVHIAFAFVFFAFGFLMHGLKEMHH